MTTDNQHQQDISKRPESLDVVIRYHLTTKHQFGRYARSLGYLDWANQPDPFRRYEGTSLFRLRPFPLQPDPSSPTYQDIFLPYSVPSKPVDFSSLSQFFELALGLSAWKQAGETRWALRNNPSSGNLHPTEGYLLIGPGQQLHPTPGLYHYAPKEHALELRLEIPEKPFSALMAKFPHQAFFVGLTSLHWREAWKYGERAFRYCQHDIGHAIGTCRIAASTLGWSMVLLSEIGDHELSELLGVNRTQDYLGSEPEHPDCLAVIWPREVSGADMLSKAVKIPLGIDSTITNQLTNGVWHGKANRLSRDNPIPWEAIDEVSQVTWKPPLDSSSNGAQLNSAPEDPSAKPSMVPMPTECYPGNPLANTIIRQRRSAVAFDGQTRITAQTFFQMMQRVSFATDQGVLQRPMPWDCMPWEPHVHLALFVHRVDDLPSGLYLLVRNVERLEDIQQAIQGEKFLWTTPAGMPQGVSLYLLQEGDARQLAAQVSCHQDIAGASAFSFGMIAEFEPILAREGSWFYRRLFWETGILGQVLYLEAEAAGIRATGIGCFFDDPVHQVFGLTDLAFQSLYHFTIGGAIDDDRLLTLPPYDHLRTLSA